MIERFGELIMLLHQGLQHIKAWFMLYSIRSQVQCCIQVMALVGAISKIKCWKSCVAGVTMNYGTSMMQKNVLLYAVFQNPKCVKEFRLSFCQNLWKNLLHEQKRYTSAVSGLVSFLLKVEKAALPGKHTLKM